MPTCANCGRESAEGFAFCPHCGATLPTEAHPAEIRKTVTVLFCDVTGSTALGERLDPESLRKVMGRYFDTARSALERHGGTVEKFIGDAVMAVFGIPRVHEDDALRACRAATEIRESVTQLSKEMERDFGRTFQVRIGVNTGEVVAGDPGAGQALVTGDAVNVAARLEQIAPPGDVLIGRSTYELVRDVAVAEPSDPLVLKGKSQATPVFRLIEVHPTAPTFARRHDSPLVGREEELGLLRKAFERVESERASHLVTVLAPAGVGKSRLVEEFLDALTGARVLRGRCLPYGEGITFYPVVEVLKQAAGVADFEDPHRAERKICDLVTDDEHGSLICARIGHLLGLSDGNAVPEETLWAIRRFLEVLGRQQPLVVVFDDIHWGEETFLDLIEHIVDWTRDASILLVCPARPELLDLRPAWAGGKANATSILLEPLPLQQCEELFDNLLGKAETAGDVRFRVLEAAEGNPLFVEQMVSMLIDDGLLIVRDDGTWVASGDLSDVPVPPTIAALLAARLDRLSDQERAVIQRASVVGKVFFLRAVAALSPESERPAVAGQVMSLVRKELVRPDRTTLPGEDAVRFRHLLIRDAAYESTPKEVRAHLHERFADWLEAVAGDRIEEQEEILGYHLEQAVRYLADLRPSGERGLELARRAAGHLSAAGRRAFARGDMGAAANLLSRAVDLLPPGDRDRLALLAELGSVLVAASEYEKASRILREAMDGARDAGDRLIGARARVADVLLRVEVEPEGTGEEAARVADELIPVFEAEGDDLGLAQAYRLRCSAPWIACRYAEMAADAELAAEHARRAGAPGEQGLAEDMLSVAYTWGPFPVAKGLHELAALQQESGGRRELEAVTAILLAMAGRLDESRRVVEQAMATFEDLGRPGWVAACYFARGVIELIGGDALAAERAFRRGRDDFLRLGEKGVLSTLCANLSIAMCRQGRFEEAESFIAESLEFASSEDVASQGGWRQAKAMVLADRGEFAEAERVGRQAVDLAMSGDGIDDQGEALSVLAEVLGAAGRSEEAKAIFRESIERFERKGNVLSAGRVRARLDALET